MLTPPAPLSSLHLRRKVCCLIHFHPNPNPVRKTTKRSKEEVEEAKAAAKEAKAVAKQAKAAAKEEQKAIAAAEKKERADLKAKKAADKKAKDLLKAIAKAEAEKVAATNASTAHSTQSGPPQPAKPVSSEDNANPVATAIPDPSGAKQKTDDQPRAQDIDDEERVTSSKHIVNSPRVPNGSKSAGKQKVISRNSDDEDDVVVEEDKEAEKDPFVDRIDVQMQDAFVDTRKQYVLCLNKPTLTSSQPMISWI